MPKTIFGLKKTLFKEKIKSPKWQKEYEEKINDMKDSVETVCQKQNWKQ